MVTARSDVFKADIQRSLSIPIQTITTTGSEYTKPKEVQLWRRPQSIYEVPSVPIEELTVHRASYKPPRPDIKIGKKVTFIDELECNSRKTTIPIENCTTYGVFFGRRYDGHPQKIMPHQLHQKTSNAPKAHNYTGKLATLLHSESKDLLQ